MGERGVGARMAGRIRRMAASVLAFILVLMGGVAWASWIGTSTATGPGAVSSWTVPSAVTTCTDTDDAEFETAVVSWPEVTDPHVLDYTATINDVDATVTDDGETRSVVINEATMRELFGNVIDGELTVEVTAVLPGTAWTGQAVTETIQSAASTSPAGLILECGANVACFATFSVDFEFGGGFQGRVTVTAGDTAISQWSTTFSIGTATMTERWNAEFSISEGQVTASNLDWNGTVEAGASRTFGFTANGPTPTGEVPVTCTGR